MRRTIIGSLLGIAASVATSYGDGYIHFDNYNSSSGYYYAATNVPAGKAGLALGSGFTASLYWAVGNVTEPTASDPTGVPVALSLLSNQGGPSQTSYPTVFLGNSDGDYYGGAGWFGFNWNSFVFNPPITLPGYTSGPVTLEVVVWANSGPYGGASYATSRLRGHSPPIVVASVYTNPALVSDYDLFPYSGTIYVQIVDTNVSSSPCSVLAGPITNSANGHIYYLLNSNTWVQSEACAVALGGHLVTVNDAAENNWVFTNFTSYGGVLRDIWIGLSDAGHQGTFTWSSGEPFSYSNWQAGEPNNTAGIEDYVHLYAGGSPWIGFVPGLWNDMADQAAYIHTDGMRPLCGVVEIVPVSQPSACSVLAGPITNAANGHTYYLLSNDTWTASEACAVALGGHLATINDAAENEWVLTNFGTNKQVIRDLWIGLSDAAQEGTFVWTSSEPYAYSNWEPGQPDNYANIEHYVQIYGGGNPPHNPGWTAGKWNDFENVASYVHDIDGTIRTVHGVVEIVQPPPSGCSVLVGPVTNAANGHIYYLLNSNTWVQSEACAVAMGGHLVTINDAAENDWVFTNFTSYGGVLRDIWIGLSDAGHQGTFTWASGEPFSYSNWQAGEPNNTSGIEDYVHLYAGGSPWIGFVPGKWNDVADQSAYIHTDGMRPLCGLVEIVPVSPPSACSVLVGPVTNAANGHIYYLLNSNTWVQSEACAVALGGHLVTINDAVEDHWVYTNFSRFGGIGSYLWIGLSDQAQEGTFVWSSGEPVTYTQWFPGEPNASVPSEDYVYIDTPDSQGAGRPGTWNDDINTRTDDFGRLPRGVVEIVPPPPPSACSGVLAGPITNVANGHIYYLLNSNNWPGAEACAVEMGGHLVTINDAAENSWVLTNFGSYGGVVRDLWIGLNDKNQEGVFVWTSGEPVTYTNWQPAQPDNGTGGTEDYVLMYSGDAGVPWQAGWFAGGWNDYVNYAMDYNHPAGFRTFNGVVEIVPATPPSACSGVLAGPITNVANGHIYYLLSNNTWTASEACAVELGGHLVTINDAVEDHWVYTNFSRFGGIGTYLWIGLSDQTQEGTFVWASGEPVTYTQWYPGEPNNSGNEDYVYIDTPNSLGPGRPGTWNDDINTRADDFGRLPRGVVEIVPLLLPPCVTAPSDLVAWWPGEGNTIDIVNGNNGVGSAGLGYGAAKVGTGFALNSTNAHIRIPASATLNVGTNSGLTLEAWIYPTNTTQPHPMFEWSDGYKGGGYGVHFWIQPGGKLFANVVDTSLGSHIIEASPNSVVANSFQHVGLTYDRASGNAVLYVNGVVVAQATLGSFIPGTTNHLWLGLRPGDSPQDITYGVYFGGILDEPSIYKRALSSNEIQSIYNASSAGKCPNHNPIAILDALSTPKNAPAAFFPAAKLVLNDIDADNDPLAVTGVGTNSTQGGTVTLVSGNVTYIPATGFTGTDTFSYSISDGHGGAAVGTVTATVGEGSQISLNIVFGPTIQSGDFVVRFAGIPGFNYTIEWSPTIAGPWTKAANTTAPAVNAGFGVGVFEFREPVGTNATRFYRTVFPAY